jgi:GxxExxY protein
MTVKDQLRERIIGCCFKVHKDLGPGFNEKIYHNALMQLLDQKGIKYQTEKEFAVYCLDKQIGSFRADLVVEDKVILEIKSLTGNILTLFEHPLFSYLKASGFHVGLLINFGNKSC